MDSGVKFIYVTDTHIGGSDSTGYRKQPRYLRKFPEIMEALKVYLKEHDDVEFILHGGDMVDETKQDSIREAVALFGQLPCPTYLVLGNHDVTEPDAIAMWLKEAPQFFPGGDVDFRLFKDGVQIDAMVCNWSDTPYYWNRTEPQVPWLFPIQLEKLEDMEMDCYTQIVLLHSPVYGMPGEQYGGSVPLHAPAGDLAKRLRPVTKNASCVLSGHNHMNTAVLRGDCYYVTGTALSEMPFEFKVIEVNRKSLSMQTVALSPSVSFCGEFDFDSAYMLGRPCDRIFNRTF